MITLFIVLVTFAVVFFGVFLVYSGSPNRTFKRSRVKSNKKLGRQ